MFFDVEDDVEIACRAAVGARLAFTGDAQSRARVDAGGNAELDGFFALDAALAAAFGAALANNLARALAGGAGARDGEETLLIGELAAAAAGLAGRYTGAFFGAGAVAGFAVFLAGELDFSSDSGGGFLESARHIVAKIGAALRTAAATATAGKNILEAEEVAEDVVEILEYCSVKSGTGSSAGKTGMAVGVVDLFLLRIA